LCHQSQEVDLWSPWPGGKKYSDVLVGGILPDNVKPPESVPSSFKNFFLDCQSSMIVERKRSCGHQFETNCHLAIKILGSDQISKCLIEISDAKLSCGHPISIECWQVDVLTRNPENFKCQEVVPTKCWNFETCGMEIDLICNFAGTPSCDQVFIFNNVHIDQKTEDSFSK
jgi:hypothetical protein